MRRVQVESPFAPQTPRGAPSEECHERCERDPICARCASDRVRVRETARNRRYLAACLADCIARGETPYASHGLLTLPGVLDDAKPEERTRGIAAGFAMREGMHASVFYGDLGWSSGMLEGEKHARQLAMHKLGAVHQIEYRTLGEDWDK